MQSILPVVVEAEFILYKDTQKHINGNETLLFLLFINTDMPCRMQIGKIVSKWVKII